MGKKKRSKAVDNSFAFLIEIFNLGSERLFKLVERGINTFRFYITLVTAFGGLFVALITTGFLITDLVLPLAISCTILFFVGVLIFIQLLNFDLDHTLTRKHLKVVVGRIKKLADLDEYYQDATNLFTSKNIESRYPIKNRYSISNILKRAIMISGIKTQLVIINSLIGTAGISFLSFTVSTKGPTNYILFGVSIFILLASLHGLYAYIRGKSV